MHCFLLIAVLAMHYLKMLLKRYHFGTCGHWRNCPLLSTNHTSKTQLNMLQWGQLFLVAIFLDHAAHPRSR